VSQNNISYTYPVLHHFVIAIPCFGFVLIRVPIEDNNNKK